MDSQLSLLPVESIVLEGLPATRPDRRSLRASDQRHGPDGGSAPRTRAARPGGPLPRPHRRSLRASERAGCEAATRPLAATADCRHAADADPRTPECAGCEARAPNRRPLRPPEQASRRRATRPHRRSLRAFDHRHQPMRIRAAHPNGQAGGRSTRPIGNRSGCHLTCATEPTLIHAAHPTAKPEGRATRLIGDRSGQPTTATHPMPISAADPNCQLRRRATR
jgi:hypothetical protein